VTARGLLHPVSDRAPYPTAHLMAGTSHFAMVECSQFRMRENPVLRLCGYVNHYAIPRVRMFRGDPSSGAESADTGARLLGQGPPCEADAISECDLHLR